VMVPTYPFEFGGGVRVEPEAAPVGPAAPGPAGFGVV